jgi:probable phosphoglycerate mutase
MSTTFLLIRHGAHDLLGKRIAGRGPGVHLNEQGRAQVESLAERLEHLPIRAVYSSPLERARETALPLAARLGLPLQVSEEITELDFGDWNGQTFEELRGQPEWNLFNSYRSGTRIPNGELMLEAQARMVAWMGRARERHPDGCVALVGHGDPIKAAVAYSLGVPLDLFQRLEISPASVSVLLLSDWGPQVLCVNHTGKLELG